VRDGVWENASPVPFKVYFTRLVPSEKFIPISASKLAESQQPSRILIINGIPGQVFHVELPILIRFEVYRTVATRSVADMRDNPLLKDQFGMINSNLFAGGTMKQIIEAIKDQCAPFLSLVQKEPETTRFLYRAANAKETNWWRRDAIRDRKPRNMPYCLHEAGDEWFSHRFGVRFRGAGIFCFGRYEEAEQYARSDKRSVFAIFPIEAFQFCWSTQVKDIHVYIGEEEARKMSREEYVGKLSRLDYRESDLLAAIDSGNEVMLACKRYYAVQIDNLEEAEHLWKGLL